MNEYETSTDREFLEKKVKLPAIFLIITAGLGILLNLINLVTGLLGIGSIGSMENLQGTQGGGMEQLIAPFMAGTMTIVFSVIGIIIGIVIIFSSMSMIKMEKWGFCMTGAILAMIPCISPCCILGIPFGIWAIVALSNADVKAAFKP